MLNTGIPESVKITDAEFSQFKQLIYKIAGINLAESKKILLMGRLGKRLRHYKLASYGEYFKLVTGVTGKQELQTMVDQLTTNETYFFREPKHFEFLTKTVLPKHSAGQTFNVWSAASSTGEEIYTLAMVLAGHFGNKGNWSILGSDLSTQVLETAKRGQYILERTRGLTPAYIDKYSTKGTGALAGTFTISADLRQHTRFMQINLNSQIPEIGRFHVIFLRNVMIYFDPETKRQVINRLITKLLPGGYLIIGHSESLNGLTDKLVSVQPTIYQLPVA